MIGSRNATSRKRSVSKTGEAVFLSLSELSFLFSFSVLVVISLDDNDNALRQIEQEPDGSRPDCFTWSEQREDGSIKRRPLPAFDFRFKVHASSGTNRAYEFQLISLLPELEEFLQRREAKDMLARLKVLKANISKGIPSIFNDDVVYPRYVFDLQNEQLELSAEEAFRSEHSNQIRMLRLLNDFSSGDNNCWLHASYSLNEKSNVIYNHYLDEYIYATLQYVPRPKNPPADYPVFSGAE